MQERKTPWNGWYWYADYLVDPNGNRYSEHMVRSSLYTMELSHELVGNPIQITSLKRELLKRLDTPPPEIIIRWEGEETSIIPPSWMFKL